MKHDSEDPHRAVLGSEVWAPGRGSLTRGAGSPFLPQSHREAGAAPPGAGLPAGGCERLPPAAKRTPGEACSEVSPVSPFGFRWVLVKPLRQVRETPFRPVSSSVPCQFCHPSSRWLLSFSPLGALKFHQVDAGEQAPGRSSASRRSRQLFWPVRPAQLGWRASGCLGSRCRWRRRGGRGELQKTREAAAALRAEAMGRGERTNFALSVSLVVVAAWFPGNKPRLLISGVMFISLASSFPPPAPF